MARRLIFGHRISLYWIIGTVFMMITMFIPTSFNVLRLLIILLWVMVSFGDFEGNRRYIRIQRLGITVFGAYLCYMVISSCHGCFSHQFDPVKGLRPNVLFPILYIIVFSRLRNEKDIRLLMKIMLCGEALNCIFDLWYIMSGMGIVTWFPKIFNRMGLELSFNGMIATYYQYTTTHMVTHIFMLPFTAVLVFQSLTQKRMNVWLIVLLGMQFICLYFSGRAAFQLSSAICLCGILGFNLFFRVTKKPTHRFSKNILIRFFLIMIVVILAFYVLVNMVEPEKNIMDIWNFITMKLRRVFSAPSETGDIRSRQGAVYIKGWLRSPLFGNGMGAFATEIDRGGTDPFATELTYVSMLLQYGLIGLILFFSVILFTIRGLYRKEKRGILSYETTIPFVFGMAAVLLATAVDPYLFTFGCIWMVYLPFSIAFIVNNERGDGHGYSEAIGVCHSSCIQ